MYIAVYPLQVRSHMKKKSAPMCLAACGSTQGPDALVLTGPCSPSLRRSEEIRSVRHFSRNVCCDAADMSVV